MENEIVYTKPAPEEMQHTSAGMFKFIFFSVISVLFFFLPIAGSTPLLLIVSWVKGLLGSTVQYWLFFAVNLLLCVTWVMSKTTQNAWTKKYHAVDGWIKGILYFVSLIVTFLVLLDIGPAWLLNWDVGYLAVDIAAPCLVTFFFASIGVSVILDSGAVEFVGTLVEKVMRPLFKLPGRAAVDCIASFVSASAVAVMFTGEAYNRKVYTDREAHAVFTCWSVVSLAFFTIMISCANLEGYYGKLVLCTFIVCFILAPICVRIPPWTKKYYKDVYIDGTEQTEERRAMDMQKPPGGRLKKAVDWGYWRSVDLTGKGFLRALVNSFAFIQKTCVMICAVGFLGLLIAYVTPIFTWIGYPLVPLINLLGFGAESTALAGSIWSGVAEVTLPAILVNSAGASDMGRFFVTLVACCQIVFLDESIPAMLETNVPVKVGKLLITFVIRTIFAIIVGGILVQIIF